MGYACPVCEDPQADAEHLANHLAFTAILGDEDHERWLERNAPGWESMDEAELAASVVEHVSETEFPQVFEDTVGEIERGRDGLEERSGALFEDERGEDAHDRAGVDDHARAGSGGGTGAPLDEEAAAILEEARQMTREMLEGDEDDEEE